MHTEDPHTAGYPEWNCSIPRYLSWHILTSSRRMLNSLSTHISKSCNMRCLWIQMHTFINALERILQIQLMAPLLPLTFHLQVSPAKYRLHDLSEQDSAFDKLQTACYNRGLLHWRTCLTMKVALGWPQFSTRRASLSSESLGNSMRHFWPSFHHRT